MTNPKPYKVPLGYDRNGKPRNRRFATLEEASRFCSDHERRTTHILTILHDVARRYEVQTGFTYGYENVWRDNDGYLIDYATRAEARAALKDHRRDLKAAGMESGSFRIAGVM